MRVDTDLQRDHEEKVEVGHPLELFKQSQGQESQRGEPVAAHQIVLATNKAQSDVQTTSLTQSEMHMLGMWKSWC